MICLRIQGAMQGDDIALGIEFFERHILHAKADAFRAFMRIMSGQATTESAQYLRDCHTNTAGAHDTDGFAAQLKPQQSLQSEIAVTHTVICVVKMPVQREYQSHAMLRYGFGRISRNSHDTQPKA